MASGFVNQFDPPRRYEKKSKLPSSLLNFEQNRLRTKRLSKITQNAAPAQTLSNQPASFNPKTDLESRTSAPASFNPETALESRTSAPASFNPETALESRTSAPASFNPKTPLESRTSAPASFNPETPLESRTSAPASFNPEQNFELETNVIIPAINPVNNQEIDSDFENNTSSFENVMKKKQISEFNGSGSRIEYMTTEDGILTLNTEDNQAIILE